MTIADTTKVVHPPFTRKGDSVHPHPLPSPVAAGGRPSPKKGMHSSAVVTLDGGKA